MGIGDTIRVSLTGDPVEEVRAAKEILKCLGLRKFGIELISCPTCGRTQIDLISIANEMCIRDSLDTPGYFDFVAESKLAMSVADTALIMVSAKSGVEVGTEKAWEYTEEMHLPRIFFVNQMDDENADFEKTLADMRVKFGKSVAPLQIPFNLSLIHI